MSEAVRVVFDTNVLLSMFVFKDSRFAPFRGEVVSGRWIALTSPACLTEFQRVLTYPLFALDDAQQATALVMWRNMARCIDSVMQDALPLPKCKDKDDQKFLELARDGDADWLVTADKLLLKLRRGRRLDGLFRILTPEEALQKVGAGGTASQ